MFGAVSAASAARGSPHRTTHQVLQLGAQGTTEQESRRGTVLPTREMFPCMAVRQVVLSTALQTVLSEQLRLLLLVLFSKTAGAETSPAPSEPLQSLF